MDRLAHVVIFTGDMAGQRRFYEEGLGLDLRRDSPEWVEFDTTGATLALHAMPDPGRQGIQLRFATDDIAARVDELSGRGVTVDPPGIERHPWGSLATLRDPEGNRLMLMQLAHPQAAGTGLPLSAVINCRDLEAQKRYYRDALGLPAIFESAWWVQLAAGGAGLGLHPRAAAARAEGHHGRNITIGFAVPELAAWHEERAARGVPFTAAPADRGFGIFADASDADGNAVTFRDVPEPETLEEQLAEPFDDESTPRRTGMRKPVSKRAKATSRVASRPQYRAGKPARKRPRVTKPAARVSSPRGTGPAGTRRKPKRKHDPKRARTKPATGRRQKAERRTFKSKKQAVAGASRRKPVKRASRARTKKRVVTRGRTARR